MEKTEEVNIDLGRLLGAVRRYSWVIALVAALCSAAGFLAARYVVTPQYTACAKFYIRNDSSDSTSPIDLNTARDLVDSCIVILHTWDTLNAVAHQANLACSVEALDSMIAAGAVDGTEIFQVSVTCPYPEDAAAIAAAVTQVLPGQVAAITGGSWLEIAELPRTPTQPSTMIPPKITLIGFLSGLILATAAVMLLEIFSDRIRSPEDITQACGYPILAVIPQEASSHPAQHGYLLQARLEQAFPSETCRILAITGPDASQTAVHLAHALSELGGRTLVMDCDLHQPSLAETLHLPQVPGLADYLSGRVDLTAILRPGDFDAVCAGTECANPLSLLRSRNMQALLEGLRQSYDEILLILPPPGQFHDTLVLQVSVDGTILVVRQDVCTKTELKEVLSQLEGVNGRILGMVFRESAGEEIPFFRQADPV